MTSTVTNTPSDRAPDAAATVQSFVEALSRRDFEVLRSLFDPQIDFRALVPAGLRTANGPAEAVQWFVTWFARGEHHETVLAETFAVADRVGFHWRVRRRLDRNGEAARWYTLQQSGFMEVGPAGIERLSLVCTGHRAESAAAAGDVQEFDAGDLGCTDGFPREFRKMMRALPSGGRARIVTRDPSAKQDLPSLARMMGHLVLGVDEPGDGRAIFTVERGR